MFRFWQMFFICFPGVFCFNKGLQVGQTHLPEVAVLVEPGIDGAQRLGIKLIDTVAALAVLPHEVGAAQQPQVLGDGRAGNGKSLGDLSGGLAAAAKQVEDRTPRGVGEGLESGFR